jgi:type IV pilus assembly protein PilB
LIEVVCKSLLVLGQLSQRIVMKFFDSIQARPLSCHGGGYGVLFDQECKMSPGAKKIKLGELLLRAGVITEPQLQQALTQQKQWGGKLGSILISMKILDEDTLVKALSRQLGLPRVDFSGVVISPEALAALPAEKALKNQVLPISLDKARKTLLVAMSDPAQLNLIDELSFLTGCKIQVAIAGQTALSEALRKYYGSEELPPEAEEAQVPQLERVSEPKPPPAAPAESDPEKLVEQLRAFQLEQARTLQFIIDTLVARGVFSREEYLSCLEKHRGE